MWKRIVCAALACTLLLTSAGASAATGRKKVAVAPTWAGNWGYCGPVNGATSKLVATLLANCAAERMGVEDRTGTYKYTVGAGHENAQHYMFYDYTSVRTDKVTGKTQTYHYANGVMVVPICSDGSNVDKNGNCWSMESVKDCIGRQMIVVDAQLGIDRGTCDTNAANENKIRKEKIAAARLAGGAGIVAMQLALNTILNSIGTFYVAGKPFTTAAQLTIGVLAQTSWTLIMNSADTAWETKIDKKKTDCYTTAQRTRDGRKDAVTLACNAP